MISRWKEGKKKKTNVSLLCSAAIRIPYTQCQKLHFLVKVCFALATKTRFFCSDVQFAKETRFVYRDASNVSTGIKVENRLWRETRRVEAQTLIAFSKRETRR